jgi:hypothetical protein
MTPKEKAIQLVNKYLCVDDYYKRDSGCRISQYEAKQCALIAVDEVIEALHEHYWQNRLIIDYWKEVKHELEKL